MNIILVIILDNTADLFLLQFEGHYEFLLTENYNSFAVFVMKKAYNQRTFELGFPLNFTLKAVNKQETPNLMYWCGLLIGVKKE